MDERAPSGLSRALRSEPAQVEQDAVLRVVGAPARPGFGRSSQPSGQGRVRRTTESSVILHNPGSALARFRDQTERAATMPGVTMPSFRCGECGRSATTKGRQRTAGNGWRCEACKRAREARRAHG